MERIKIIRLIAVSQRPKDYKHGHRKRLRGRFTTSGLEGLLPYEVLELLLSFAIPRRDVKDRAKNLLEAFGSLKGVLDAEFTELCAVEGIGERSATLLKLCRDLSVLYLKQKAVEKQHISSTEELLAFCRMAMGSKKDEEFVVIFLDSQNKIIEVETIQKGIVNKAVVYPRQILERALARKAAAIILAHNHPSGNVRPSEADLTLTKTIQETARILDILVHDHIIVGEDRVFSFRQEGLLY